MRNSGFIRLIIITTLIIICFTGGIVYGVQDLVGGGTASRGEFIDGAREFRISVRQWSFEPAVIEVNPGERVRFFLTSADVWHGFAINELGINLATPFGETAMGEVVIPADIPEGIYTMYCSIFCGLGHPYLKGQITIGDPKFFLGLNPGKLLPYSATLAVVIIFAAFVVIGGRRAIK